MAFKIIRNDITLMDTEAIVNTANQYPIVGTGCDGAVYSAAGREKLLEYRKNNIGFVPEGDVFITPGFDLKAKYIIHAVSPLYEGGKKGEEAKLRSCYRKSLQLAKEKGIRSIAFPLISTGGFDYPKEEGMRIAMDEINAFLLDNNMDVFLVVFDQKASSLANNIYPGLQEYIDQHYVEDRAREEYGLFGHAEDFYQANYRRRLRLPEGVQAEFTPELEKDLAELINHTLDHTDHSSYTFSQYMMYLIGKKGMRNAEVYRRALVDVKLFGKIKNNKNYHPQKITALCLCVGLKLNLDETKDLLRRASYALSPCDRTDLIFSFFIEHEIYDMIEIDIQLGNYDLPQIIPSNYVSSPKRQSKKRSPV